VNDGGGRVTDRIATRIAVASFLHRLSIHAPEWMTAAGAVLDAGEVVKQ